MKKIYNCLVAVLFLTLIVGFTACSNEQDLTDENPVTKAVDENDLIVISKLGFDPSSVVDKGDYYLVEGDIVIPKENIAGYTKAITEADTSRLKQAHHYNLVSIGNISDIKIKIDAWLYSVSNWRQATLDAMAAFNNTSSAVKMREVTSGEDITIKSGNLHIDVCGNALYPSSLGAVGNRVLVNTQYNRYTLSEKTHLLVHELGHTIGIAHTNWRGIGGSGTDIFGTPSGSANPDPASVFNGATCGYPWNGFSAGDLLAIRTLYPSNAINKTCACANEYVTFTLQNTPTGYVKWEAVQNATLVATSDVKSAIFKVSGNGYAKVKAVITNSSSVTTENLQIWVGVPGYDFTEEDTWFPEPICINKGIGPENDIYPKLQGVDGNNLLDYKWTQQSNNFRFYYTSGNRAIIQPLSKGDMIFTYSAKNKCGWSVTPQIFQIPAVNCN